MQYLFVNHTLEKLEKKIKKEKKMSQFQKYIIVAISWHWGSKLSSS